MTKRQKTISHSTLDDKIADPSASFSAGSDAWVESAFASRYSAQPTPKDRLPDQQMPPNIAYQLIKDMRQLDSNPRLNLASFVTTWMEPEAEKLIQDSLNVNFVDMEEYPSSTEIQNRCVAMLASLYNAPGANLQNAVGTACIGSSEAIMLAGLAMKKRWQERRKKEGKSDAKPNLVMGYNVQVCWEKFTRYFDVEERFVPLTEDCYVTRPEEAVKMCDENTIGICGILGSTYTGHYEDIAKMDELVEKLNKETGWNIGIHVDGASGGMVAPFIHPDLVWDFRLKNVVSINTSGHKYGLVYPGIGWVVWRSKEFLPEALVFHVNYLGSDQPSFTLNFSKSAAPIIAQYYQFLRLGKEGYTKIMRNLTNIAAKLAEGVEETGHFKILSDPKCLPLVAFALIPKKDEHGNEKERPYNEFDVADKLRARGWVVPAYTMAPNIRHVKLLRCVIREDLSMSMVEELINDIKRVIEYLDNNIVLSKDEIEQLQKGNSAALNMHKQRAKKLRLHVVRAEHHDEKHHPNKKRMTKHNGVC
jgi:glutamate decarboxylase